MATSSVTLSVEKAGRRLAFMSGGGRSDAELVSAFARRESGAAEELYRRFAPRIFGLGIVMLGSPAQAEDLVQDTFVKVWRKVGSYEASRGSLDTWVLLIARSLAIDLIRRRVLEARVLASQEDPADALEEPGPEQRAETMDLSERARKAMETLTPPQRAALELAYFGGRTSTEVAELEGIPVGTAKTRIRTALIRLREALEFDHEM
jgi:RNA polymerase sigma-70 factor (ECF subfamily)